MKQEIRIIGGVYRGKKLQFPDIEGLRPTPDRVRETLFNWLMGNIKGARCLDAFAGSGALGFEAFSRGASEVVFLEYNSKAQTQLQKIIRQFNNPQLSLIKIDARIYLQRSKKIFDIIFLDPPFCQQIIPDCLNYIATNNLMPPGGLVYVEAGQMIEQDSLHWKKIKLKQAGQVIYSLLEKL